MIRTAFAEKVHAIETGGISKDKLMEIHGSGRGRRGIFLGDGDEGMFEAGQCSGLVREIKHAREVMDDFVEGWYS